MCSTQAEQEAKVKRAWTAHKSDDGTVYYYNPLTNESSWSEPEGFSGDAEAVEAQPVRCSLCTAVLRCTVMQWAALYWKQLCCMWHCSALFVLFVTACAVLYCT